MLQGCKPPFRQCGTHVQGGVRSRWERSGHGMAHTVRAMWPRNQAHLQFPVQDGVTHRDVTGVRSSRHAGEIKTGGLQLVAKEPSDGMTGLRNDLGITTSDDVLGRQQRCTASRRHVVV